MKSKALEYLAAGLCVLPARRLDKRPVGAWKPFQSRLPLAVELSNMFTGPADAICIVCGQVSGNAEMIDFDGGGALFDDWHAAVMEADSALVPSLFIERSPSGGFHVVYRCTEAISGNMKLAQQLVDGKAKTFIETRGEGGLFLCSPTPGYEAIQGDLTNLPTISPQQRDVLLGAAWSLNQMLPTPEPMPMAAEKPGDDYNRRGEVRDLLRSHGWAMVKAAGDNEHWRRPGKDAGSSATIRIMDGIPILYVFSSNAAPFEPQKGYSPFAVYARLEHVGDFAAASAALRGQGFGGEAPPPSDVDFTAMTVGQAAPIPEEPEEVEPASDAGDPGAIPDHLLDVPGFIADLMAYTMATAPYPNRVLAFSGALAMQSFLAGRKVRDSMNNRSSLYLLALADSGTGKDHPRRVNAQIMVEIGATKMLGDAFASGEGIADRMHTQPSALFQTDEIDLLVSALNHGHDPRTDGIMEALLKMYTAAGTLFPMRVKAGGGEPDCIDQPSLVLFGTAIPQYYYGAMSQKMLENGFFSRLLILEAGRRARGQIPRDVPLPPEIVQAARWWAEFVPGGGNMAGDHPNPATVPHTPQAMDAFADYRSYTEDMYDDAYSRHDGIAKTIWTRAAEKAARLALCYACSVSAIEPLIDERAVTWACEFVRHQTRRMLWMAGQHCTDNPFHGSCLKALRKIREEGGSIGRRKLFRYMKETSRTFEEIMRSLEERGDIRSENRATGGRPSPVYVALR